jgi:hypothetical protein
MSGFQVQKRLWKLSGGSINDLLFKGKQQLLETNVSFPLPKSVSPKNWSGRSGVGKSFRGGVETEKRGE